MSSSLLGAVLGGLLGVGTFLVLGHVLSRPRRRFDQRVGRYLSDIPALAPKAASLQGVAAQQVFSPVLQGLASRLESVLGGAASVRRRIDRAGLPLSLHEFRVEQVVWGLVAFAAMASLTVVVSLRSPSRTVPLLVLCAVAFVLGVMLRENRLTAQVQAHERRVLEEMPAIAELLALSVAAGEGPVAAIDRVVSRTQGALSADLGRVLGEIRTGRGVGEAFDAYAARTGLPVMARFASGVAVAVERGTPLADVLHAQAADVREAQRRALIESGARREVLMMVPVVFLVMPTTVLFAFWPGVVGLNLVTP